MKRLKVRLFSCMVGAVLIALLLAPAVVEAASIWRVVPSPNVGSNTNTLSGVTAISQRDAWAVGNFTTNNGNEQTLTEQWNGTQWSVVASPNVGTGTNALFGVAAVSQSDVWAVGNSETSAFLPQTLTLQWNGTQWSVVASPNVGSNENFLAGLAVISANDIWAVGEYLNTSSIFKTLILHWNGHKWSVVASPNAGSGSNVFFGVTADSASDVWAVGEFTNSSSVNQTLTEHWNGTTWSVVASPNMGSGNNALTGVAAVSTSDVWAVGGSFNGPFIEQWNGTKWSIVLSPAASIELNGVTVISASDIWAVGQVFQTAGVIQTLTLHWNGTKWKAVASPNPSPNFNQLAGAASIPRSSELWAVGEFTNPSGVNQTLTELHY
jgi:hypothetical protein